ncbi:MAG: hypothetical protein AAGE52_38915 [Myxococcota bacterium]
MDLWPACAIALTLGLACGGEERAPQPRQAAEFHSETVESALESAAAVVRTRGFTEKAEEPWRGFLVDRGASVDEVRLRRGNCYVVLGATTPGVRSLTVTLHDSDGGEVARSGPAAGAVRYCPPRGGTYFVAVHADGSGLFAVRWFEGPTGLEIRLDDLIAEGRP